MQYDREKETMILIGGGGHARSCLSVIRASNSFNVLGVIERRDIPVGKEVFKGVKVIGHDSNFRELIEQGHNFHIAMGHTGNPERRIKLFYELLGMDATLPSIVSPLSTVIEQDKIGRGTIVMHGAIVNANTEIGENCIINSGAIVEHDCKVDSHSHIAPGAILNGNVRIGRGVLIGSGAVVMPGIKIADYAIVGAGAVVTHNIYKPGVYVGLPAKKR